MTVAIIGGGPAGLSAAIELDKQGIKDVVIIERNGKLGGILNQCIHNGFGLHIFKEELTGPEYAYRLIEQVKQTKAKILLNTFVIDLAKDKTLTLMSQDGIKRLKVDAVILAMGCRERPRGAINIPGTRPAGIFSAGTAQELVNLKGKKVGKKAVILGSGDIGLIMARRLTFEGVEVKKVVELMPYSSGLKRNIVQCLDDYNIPLQYSSTITDIDGEERLTGVWIAKVDENKRPISGTEEYIECDTLLLSVGLLPENELTKQASVRISPKTQGAIVDQKLQTNIEGIFSCGNVLHVHDLVDNVSEEAIEAANSVAGYLNSSVEKSDSNEVSRHCSKSELVPVEAGNGLLYVVPQLVDKNCIGKNIEFKFRSNNAYIENKIKVYFDDELVIERKKRIITPGEMEKIKISGTKFNSFSNLRKIEVRIGV